MKTDERNKFAIKSFLGEYLDLRKDKDTYHPVRSDVFERTENNESDI